MIKKLTKLFSRSKNKPESVSYDDAWSFFEIRKKVYDESTDVLAKIIPSQGAVVVDVGANIGYFSAMLSSKVSGLELHLFEPLPNLGMHCQKTISDCNLNAKFYPFALSDQNGEFTLYTAADGNIGWNTLEKDKASSDMEATTISTKLFSDLQIGKVDLIKIDVEGAEWRVLSGMMPWLSHQNIKPIIQIEIGWGISHPHWDKEMEQFQNLLNMGYRVQDFTGALVNLSGLTTTTDVIFMVK